MSGESQSYIWDKMPYVVAMQFYALWWMDKDEQRRMTAFGKVASIEVVYPIDSEMGNESVLVV